MDIQRIMTIVDASYQTQYRMDGALRDIDRRALNAMVLVKRHGNALAGYGVIARAFREGAANLKESGATMKEAVAPFVRSYMRVLQHRHYVQSFHHMHTAIEKIGKTCPTLDGAEVDWAKIIVDEEAEGLHALRALLQAVQRIQEQIAEQEYVVTNGRIEAALSEGTGAPLMRVSRDMGSAVELVSETIRNYHNQLEELLHESSTGF